MENRSVIDGLNDVRANLVMALQAAEGLRTKLVGPRPSDTQKNSVKSESVKSLIDDIALLSQNIRMTCEDQHVMLGGFGADVPNNAIRASGY